LTFSYEKNIKSKKRYDLWNLDIETGKETALASFESESGQMGSVMNFSWSDGGKKFFIVRVVFPPPDVLLIKNRDISLKPVQSFIYVHSLHPLRIKTGISFTDFLTPTASARSDTSKRVGSILPSQFSHCPEFSRAKNQSRTRTLGIEP